MKPETKERLIKEATEFHGKLDPDQVRLQQALDRINLIDKLSDSFEKSLDNLEKLEAVFDEIELSGISIFEVLSSGMPQYWGGSCQYDTIGQVVYTSEFFREHGWSFKQWTEFFGIDVTWVDVDHTGAFENAKEIVLENADDDEKEEFKQLIEEFDKKVLNKELTSVEAAYHLAMNRAWDLWSTGFHLDTLVGYDIQGVPKVKNSRGPLFNRIAQSDNYELGFGIAAMIAAEALALEATTKFGFDT